MTIEKEKLLSIYQLMYLTRCFEVKTEELNKEKRILGSIHTSVGEEAVAVGVASVLREDDVLSASYRDMGSIFAKGITPEAVAGMLYGKECGATQGRTRVLHVGDLDRNILPANPILGASTAIAIGAALAFKQDGEDRVVLNMFGDGASNEGAVHESMNFASVFKLPIVFIIKNNCYAWSTPTEKIVNTTIIADRAKAYGFPSWVADGNDIMEIVQVVGNAVEYSRSGQGPCLVECRTYRMSGHSGNDQNVYREQDEMVWHKQDCPVAKVEGYLVDSGILDEKQLADIKSEIEMRIEKAIEQAEAAPFPDPAEALSVKAMLY